MGRSLERLDPDVLSDVIRRGIADEAVREPLNPS